MEKIVLKAQVRSGTGKNFVKKLRLNSQVPAVVYNQGKESVSLQIMTSDINDILRSRSGMNALITLKITGGEGAVKDKTVLIKEVQREPIKNGILHVDFNEISLTDTINVNVPIKTKGEAVGVKVGGGMLEHVIWELHVECLPTDIPEAIEVDISNLNVGESIHVKDIVVPKGVKVVNDPELIAIIVKAHKEEVVSEVSEAEAGAGPELIRKKKEESVEEPSSAAAEAPKEAKKE